MENPIIMSDEEKIDNWWQSKKQELLDGINATIVNSETEAEVLEIMKELVENAKVKSSMSSYYDDLEDKEVV